MGSDHVSGAIYNDVDLFYIKDFVSYAIKSSNEINKTNYKKIIIYVNQTVFNELKASNNLTFNVNDKTVFINELSNNQFREFEIKRSIDSDNMTLCCIDKVKSETYTIKVKNKTEAEVLGSLFIDSGIEGLNKVLKELKASQD